MMISTKGRYALRVMLDLAQEDQETFLPLNDIAHREGISEKYLESILKSLVRGGLVVGLRGKGGGYKLTRPASQYSVGEILRLEEEDLAPVACVSETAKPCANSAFCPTLPMWTKLNGMINQFFDSISLADLLDSKEPAGEPQT